MHKSFILNASPPFFKTQKAASFATADEPGTNGISSVSVSPSFAFKMSDIYEKLRMELLE